jgi:hypothetical protein
MRLFHILNDYVVDANSIDSIYRTSGDIMTVCLKSGIKIESPCRTSGQVISVINDWKKALGLIPEPTTPYRNTETPDYDTNPVMNHE